MVCCWRAAAKVCVGGDGEKEEPVMVGDDGSDDTLGRRYWRGEHGERGLQALVA